MGIIKNDRIQFEIFDKRQCAGPARYRYGGPAGASEGALPQTAAWPASTSAAFMMPPIPKAGAILIPKATT